MREGEHTARHGKAHQLQLSIRLRTIGVTLLGECTTLHTSDTTGNVEGSGYGTGRILTVRHIGNEGTGIEVTAQTSGWQHHGNTIVVKFLGKVIDELRSLTEILHVERLIKSLCHCLHRAHIDTAIGEESLVERNELHHLLGVFGILGCDDTTLGEAQFAGREIDDVEVVGEEMIDFLRLHELATSLAGLHEIYVVLQEGCVEHRLHSHLMTNVGHGKHILQRYGLTADEVGSRLHANESHSVGTYLLDALTQVLEVEVTLEGVVALGQESLGIHEFLHRTAQSCDMSLGGGEVEVHQCHHTGLHESLSEDVLAGTSLVGWQHVLCTEHLFHRSLHTIEGLGACIGIVSLHHGTKLQVAHGVDTRVGQHIHIDVLVLEQEGVVACLLNLLESVLHWQKRELLYHSYLVHFEWHLVLTLIEFYSHLNLVFS